MSHTEQGPERGRRALDAAYYLSSFVVLAILLIVSVSAGFGSAEVVAGGPPGHGAAGAAELGEGQPSGTAPVRDWQDLPCFACHAIERYRDGGEGAFPHEFHQEMLQAQTCHDCHAFGEHSTPIIADLEECADCH
jgi:hypothetical protein